jgi:fructose-1,6-bisphosphatase/inositol monophosphatase family enzyme
MIYSPNAQKISTREQKMTDWRKALHNVSKNVQSKVFEVIPKRGILPYYKFKNLLDNQAQEGIIETLTKYNINATLISEEGNKTFGDGEFIITADPVDGTTNLSRGLQPSVLSISVATGPNQRNVIAGIVSNFYTGETYFAQLNKTPTLDDFPIQPAQYIKYQNGLIGIDMSKDPKLEKTNKLITESRHTRQEGCSAASLCHVADGTLDAHIDLRGIVRATDISAGLFIIKEAGGVYSVNGELFGDFKLTRETRCTVIAANSEQLHKEIMELIE